MKTENNYEILTQIKALDLVEYLADLGYEPARIRNANYWYHSPLRIENTPSFKVNRSLNRWYDHGIGQGGSILDFGMLYHGCSIGEFITKMSRGLVNATHGIVVSAKDSNQHLKQVDSESKLTVTKFESITSASLIRYLHSRCISLEIARRYLQQVSYQINGKEYFGLGFANNAGGYEIRNPYFKASSSPKDITTIANNTSANHTGKVCVFEGFFDFLSFVTLGKNKLDTKGDCVILNSVSFFEKARPELEKYPNIHLYLDRDTAGQKTTEQALSISPKYKDESHRYTTCKDLNDWLISSQTFHRKSLRQRAR